MDRRAEHLLAARPRKLSQDVSWNLVSLGLVGVSGIILNVLIARHFGAATLGVFNQTFAAYIVFSQFAAGGVHLSAVRHVAQSIDDPRAASTIITSAAALTALLALPCTGVFWFGREWIGRLLDSPGVVTGMAWATPGLFCFALNKTLLGVLNGLRWMRLYAVAQALRFVLMIGTLLAVMALERPSDQFTIVFSVAELTITLGLLALLATRFCCPGGPAFWTWMRRHLDFGVRSFGSGVLLILNTRIDVLMLSYFWTDAIVGVYSFAAMLVEGLAQLPIVLRTNLNPVLAQQLKRLDYPELDRLIRRARRVTHVVMSAVAVAVLAAYPFAVGFLTDKREFVASWPILAVLLVGLTIASGYMPFGQILLQAGRPGAHTFMTIVLVAFNVAANIAFIPVWRGLGAALATSLTFGVSVLLLKLLARRIVRIDL